MPNSSETSKILYRVKRTGVYTRLFVTAFMGFACILLVIASWSNHRQFKESERANVIRELSLIRAKLEGNINTSAQTALGVVTAIGVDPQLSQHHFNQIGQQLFRQHSLLRNIGAAPDMVIRYLFPLEGNEAALGFDYRTSPEQWKAVNAARMTGELIIAGPVNLKQGGRGLIGRLPVFIYDESGESGTFWGMVSAVIDLDHFYRDSGLLDDELGIEIAIRGKDGEGESGDLFFGSNEIFLAKPVLAKVMLPSGSWQMAAIPKGGWSDYWSNSWNIHLIGLLLILAMLSLGTFILKLMARREEQEIRLQSLFDLSPIGIALNDFNTGEFLDVNRALLSPTGYDIQEFKNLSYWDLTPSQYETSEVKQLDLLSNTGRYGPYEKEYVRKDGTRYPVLLNGVLIENAAGNKYIWSMVEDISDRKRAQRELEESRGELQNFFDHSNNFMVILNEEGCFEKINSSFSLALGYSEDELIGSLAINFVHPEDKESTEAEAKQLAIGNESTAFNNRYRRKNGSYLYLKWHAAANIETGKVYATAIDITSQITDEEKILRQQEMLESMSEQAKIGAWEINLETNKVYWSDMTKKIHGLHLGFRPTLTSVLDFYKPGKSRSVMEQAIQLSMERGVDFSEEVQIVTANNSELWVTVTGKAQLMNNQCVRIYGSFQDINSRKLTEEKIRNTRTELEQQMRLLKVIADSQANFIGQADIKAAFNNLLDNIISLTNSDYGFIGEIMYLESGEPYLKTRAITDISWDEDSRRLYQQQKSAGMEFYNLKSLFGKAMTTLQPVIANDPAHDPRRAGIPKGHPDLNAFLGIPILLGDKPLAMVGLANRPGGYDSELVEWLHPLLNSIGQFVEGVRGIRARNEAEEELLAAKDAAEAAAKAKSDFLAIMSHEIRTPLNGIMGMLNLLARSGMAGEQKRKLDIASHSSETLLTIINDILDFSKVDAGKIELESLDFNVSKQLDEFAESMAMRAQEKGLELIVDQTAIEHPMVNGDPGRIRQILSNLVGNAIKFTDSGEIVVCCGLTSVGDELELRISITDTGIGIPAKKIETLFDPFTQVDASTTRTYGGTGLGLAISKKLCQLMDGDISIVSEFGRGSRFEFFLHLKRSEVDGQQPSVNLKGKRLLVVDGNATSRELLRNILVLWGANVITADNGEHALSTCAASSKNTFDVIIVDQIMPDISGAELATQLKYLPHLSTTPLVVMNRISETSLETLAEVGFSGHITKPITGYQLCECLTIVLAGGSTLSGAYSRGLWSHHPVSESVDESAEIERLHRVLLVEDNPVNQDVAKMMLDDAGVIIDVAGNGLEAIDALLVANESDNYALILMDCQMPEMDGYEASRQIRQGAAGGVYRHIPILAMTANAMKGDREKCFAAGMSDYISKPIDPEVLEQKVQQWLEDAPTIIAKRSRDKTTPQAQSMPVEIGEEPVIDLEQCAPEWNTEALLASLKGRQDRVIILLKSFNKRMDSVFSEFDQAVNNNDIDKIGFIAHSVKGSAGQLMALPLQQVAKELEESARLGEKDKVLSLCQKFKQLSASLFELTKAYVTNEKD